MRMNITWFTSMKPSYLQRRCESGETLFTKQRIVDLYLRASVVGRRTRHASVPANR